MNRENLWRGKDQFGKWVYGTYYKHITRTPSPIGDGVKPEDIQHLIIRDGFSDWNLPRGIELIEVDGDTVGQYTGLDDKNGERIFEGDVVSISGLTPHPDWDYTSVVGIVEWCGSAFEVEGQENDDYTPYGWLYDTCQVCREKFGNIYDDDKKLQEEMRNYYDGNI